MRAVIFDLDDTLYRGADFEESVKRSLVVYLARRYRRDPEPLMSLLAATQRSSLSTYPYPFGEFLASAELPEDEVVPLNDLLRRHEPELLLFPDAVRFIERVSPRVRLGVVADGDSMLSRNKLRALGLVGCFHAIAITGDGGEAWSHPSPLPHLAVLHQLRVPAEHAIFVGDDPKRDAIVPAKVGMRAIRVRREGAPARNGQAARFSGEVASLEELLVEDRQAAG